jgi:hypothetical protein
MASKKQHAAIDFQGAATIKIDGATTASQYLGTTSSGNLTWLPATTTAAGMGSTGMPSGYQGLIHSSLGSVSTNFALAQSSTGTTILNSVAGKSLYLRTEGGSSATDQIVIDGGTVSFQGSIGSEGQVLTCDANSKAVWGDAVVKKKTYEFRWAASSPPSGCTFHAGTATNDTVRLTHTLGSMCIVNMIDVNDFFGAGAGYGLDMGADVSVFQGNNTLDIVLTSVSTAPIHSANKNFKVIIIG